MIAQWVQAPEVAFYPKDAEGDGIVLLGCAKREPDIVETLRAGQVFVLADVGIIVPQETAAQARCVHQKTYGPKENQKPEPVSLLTHGTSSAPAAAQGTPASPAE